MAFRIGRAALADRDTRIGKDGIEAIQIGFFTRQLPSLILISAVSHCLRNRIVLMVPANVPLLLRDDQRFFLAFP